MSLLSATLRVVRGCGAKLRGCNEPRSELHLNLPLDSTHNFNWTEKERLESFSGILVLTQLLLTIINSWPTPGMPGYLGYFRKLHHDMESW
jgi:hypothetical protein